MKRFLSIIILAVALTGCSAQRRAERHVRRALELCPELAQAKARPIDTTLLAPTFADAASIPLAEALAGETVYAATDHGTVVVSLSQPDSSLRVGFVAAPQPVRYRDTIRWRELDPAKLQPEKADGGNHFWSDLALWIIGIGMGMVLCSWLLRNALK
jgi:hypothetical protein